MKKASVGAILAANPVNILFGEVISVNPLEINIEQKLTLTESQLILTRNVMDYDVEMTVEHETEDETTHIHVIHDTYTNGGTSEATTHKHEYAGRKIFTVHNALVEGEKVILLCMQGGQRFIVIDRLGVIEDDTV